MTNHAAPYVGVACVAYGGQGNKEDEEQTVQDEDHGANGFTGIGILPVWKQCSQNRNCAGTCRMHVKPSENLVGTRKGASTRMWLSTEDSEVALEIAERGEDMHRCTRKDAYPYSP